MKNSLKLDSYLTSDGQLHAEKSALRKFYNRLLKGEARRDKETKIKLNLVLYPKFFSESRRETVLNTEESNIDKAARIQNTSPEAIRILHKSQGSIKVKDFSKKVLSISKM